MQLRKCNDPREPLAWVGADVDPSPQRDVKEQQILVLQGALESEVTEHIVAIEIEIHLQEALGKTAVA